MESSNTSRNKKQAFQEVNDKFFPLLGTYSDILFNNKNDIGSQYTYTDIIFLYYADMLGQRIHFTSFSLI